MALLYVASFAAGVAIVATFALSFYGKAQVWVSLLTQNAKD